MTVKEITYGQWEQAKKTFPTNTDDSLAYYLLDLYFNDLMSPLGESSSYLPLVFSSDQQSSREGNKYVSFQYFMLDTTVNRELFVYENIHVLNIRVNKVSRVPHENILT